MYNTENLELWRNACSGAKTSQGSSESCFSPLPGLARLQDLWPSAWTDTWRPFPGRAPPYLLCELPWCFTLPDSKDLSHDLKFTLDHPQGSKCTEKWVPVIHHPSCFSPCAKTKYSWLSGEWALSCFPHRLSAWVSLFKECSFLWLRWWRIQARTPWIKCNIYAFCPTSNVLPTRNHKSLEEHRSLRLPGAAEPTEFLFADFVSRWKPLKPSMILFKAQLDSK